MALNKSYSLSLSFLLIVTVILFFPSCNQKPDNNAKPIANDTITNQLTLLTNAIIANPNEIKPLLDRSLYYAHTDKYNDALADVNAALEINENDPEIYIALSEIYLYSGKTQRALNALKKAKELSPNNDRVDVSTAHVYLTMSDYKQTFNALREALKKNPDNAEAFFISGLANEEIGDTTKAIDSYQNAVARDKKHFDALKQLGILFSLKHDPLAIDYLRNAAQLKPEQPEPLYILGMHYQENGQPDKALSVYQEILQIDSTYKLAHYNTGYVYLVYKQEYANAIDAFSRALKIDPEYTDALYNRGYAKELSGSFTEARKDYQQVLRMKVNDDKAVQGLNRLDAIEE